MNFWKHLCISWSFLLLAGCSIQNEDQSPPAIALTFDGYETTYSEAFPIMKNYGLVGTFFVYPLLVENKTITKAQLSEMQTAGWSIQAYSGTSMVGILKTEGTEAARKRLVDTRQRMSALGFHVTALAAGGRAWNMELRDLAKGIYRTVRVAKNTKSFQKIPFLDPLYVDDGGTASLSANDTLGSFRATLTQLEQNGGLWIVIGHKVGDDGDPMYSIPKETFEAFCKLIKDEVAAHRLRVVTLH